ncbi:MAG: hypothetical protein IPJ79_09775 [Bacteroidetes bacterium]|nr:hypothetical protein [Bacteroidota bacterium]
MSSKSLRLEFLVNNKPAHVADYRIYRHDFKKTFSEVYNDAQDWIGKSLKENQCAFTDQERIPRAVYHQGHPGIILQCLFFLRFVKNLLKHYFKLFFIKEIWNVGIINKPITEIFKPVFFDNVKWLPEPENGFNADPFGYVSKQGLNVFYEKLFFNNNIGDISMRKYNDVDGLTDERIFLKQDTHLSYPFFLDVPGTLYMIPESCEANSLTAFRMDKDNVEIVDKLILFDNAKIVDPTIIFYNARYWLFCTLKGGLPDLKLNVFYSDELNGNWTSHKRNPVKTSIQSARPGGTPFLFNGSWVRPSQDSSYSYGDRIVLNKIVKLTEEEFEEEVIGYAEPKQLNKYKRGLHTLSAAGNYTLIDAKRNKLSFNIKPIKKCLRLVSSALTLKCIKISSRESYFFKINTTLKIPI